ncbi:MAG TPA: SEFIR domain-containing protein [Pseudonocardiaceae bacterium]|jgi:hypothetical protein
MTSTDELPAGSPYVFVSYAHDSARHEKDVITFGTLLRIELGINAHLDEWHVGDRRDWSEWAPKQLETADFVLAIASPMFRERADGQGDVKEGRGSRYEGALMRDKMTEDRDTWMRKILPVVLPGGAVSDIPRFLQPYAATHYLIDSLTLDGVLELWRVLVQQPLHPLPPLGTAPPLPTEEVLTFPPRLTPATKAGNTVKVKKARAKNIVGGDFHSHG